MLLGHVEVMPSPADVGWLLAAAEGLGDPPSTLTTKFGGEVGNAGVSLFRRPLKYVGYGPFTHTPDQSGSNCRDLFRKLLAFGTMWPSSSGRKPPAHSRPGCLMSWVSCWTMPSPGCAGTLRSGQFDDESGQPFADTRRQTAFRLNKALGKCSRKVVGWPVTQGRRPKSNPGEHHAAFH